MMIQVIEHRERATARAIHAVQMVAYAQEAALLGVTYFPPLEETPEDIMAADATFLGAQVGDALAGALSIEAPDGPAGERLIGSLVKAKPSSCAGKRGGVSVTARAYS